MAKRIDIDLLNLIAKESIEGGIMVTLPEAVRADRDVMLWMYHYAFDMMTDFGAVTHETRPLEELLGMLSCEIVAEFVLDLIYQAQEATSRAKKLTRSRRFMKLGWKRR